MLAKCICTNCAGHLEFEEENAGESIQCPHCGFKTTLFLPGEQRPSSASADLARARALRIRFVSAGLALVLIALIGFAFFRWAVPWLQDFEPAIDSNTKAIAVLVVALALLPLVLLWLIFPAMLLWQLRKLTDALLNAASRAPSEEDVTDLEQEGEPAEVQEERNQG